MNVTSSKPLNLQISENVINKDNESKRDHWRTWENQNLSQ